MAYTQAHWTWSGKEDNKSQQNKESKQGAHKSR